MNRIPVWRSFSNISPLNRSIYSNIYLIKTFQLKVYPMKPPSQQNRTTLSSKRVPTPNKRIRLINKGAFFELASKLRARVSMNDHYLWYFDMIIRKKEEKRPREDSISREGLHVDSAQRIAFDGLGFRWHRS